MRRLLAGLAFLVLPLMAEAQPSVVEEDVVLGLSHSRVRITTNFDGSEILIFGAIRREAPMPESELDVIIAVAGPSNPVVVRKKARHWGIWINTESAEIRSAPSLYAVASSAPLSEILSEQTDTIYRITAPRAVWTLGSEKEFAEAVLRIRQNQGLYTLKESSVEVTEQTLFRTSVSMPANLTEGAYRTRVFLLRDQQVVSDFETVIDVHKVGLERYLFNLSREHSLAYGILALVIAIAAGWGASAAFRMLSRA
ncbi:MAG: hypothetical protein EP318_09375 [Rhodobacteraceae bacterium]|nr:MAG: hypothetical protein EP318_09375 [Paracoccaceae bacterium]